MGAPIRAPSTVLYGGTDQGTVDGTIWGHRSGHRRKSLAYLAWHCIKVLLNPIRSGRGPHGIRKKQGGTAIANQ
jgi:hypothetical protein